MRTLVVTALVAGLAAGMPTPGATAPPPADVLVEGRVSEGHTLRDGGQGGVWIEATHLSPQSVPSRARSVLQRYPLDRHTVFVIAMDTHSVDLSRYDMERLSELRAGGRGYAPVRWEAIAESSHHRLGALIFPRVDLPADLVIAGVAGVPARVFRWLP